MNSSIDERRLIESDEVFQTSHVSEVLMQLKMHCALVAMTKKEKNFGFR
jgi:hypothetical protein